jgi:ubiquinone/menaquinone biosynthesis C-methylase UbiE
VKDDDLSNKLHELLKSVSKEDEASSSTIRIFKGNTKFASKIISFLNSRLHEKERMLDLGCGYGGLTILMGKLLGIRELYGIDIDDNRLQVAKSRGICAFKLNLEEERFPFPDNYFDLVTTFGVLEHLKFYDNVIAEAYRVLKEGGLFLISTTNLASYVNRMALLLGYQPRNLEISRQKLVGIMGVYKSVYKEIQTAGHISSPTLCALRQLLESYGFQVEKTWGSGMVWSEDLKINSVWLVLIRVFDYIFSRKASFSIRLFTVARKGVATCRER